jgi:hypothetical protein
VAGIERSVRQSTIEPSTATDVARRWIRATAMRGSEHKRSDGVTGPSAETPSHRWRVRLFERPAAPFHDGYQAYYWQGLREHVDSTGGIVEATTLGRFPTITRRLLMAQARGLPARLAGTRGTALVGRMLALAEGEIAPPAGTFHLTVGQYLFEQDGQVLRACIDSADHPDLSSLELLDWADIYFKVNRWAVREYPASVRPMFGLDPRIPPELDTFRSYRSREKDIDVYFVTRVWATDPAAAEHTVSLLEAVARARCNTRMLAVVVGTDVDWVTRRLSSAGVPWSFRDPPTQQVWETTARSRLVVMRLGVHQSISWRLTGVLAAGACPVFDRTPFTEWPEPLVPNEHFLDLELPTRPGEPAAPADAYAVVPHRLEAWAVDSHRTRAIATHNGEYFDRHLTPERVDASIISTMEELVR